MVKGIAKKIERVVFILVVALFFFVIAKYFYPVFFKTQFDFIFHGVEHFLGKYQFVSCGSDQVRVVVTDGVLCREKMDDSPLLNIYDTYPKFSDGRDVVYEFLNQGDMKIADDYLKNYHYVERFNPVQIDPITWTEDPYNERYWRFIFYSLRSTHNLMYATEQTGDKVYDQKLIEIVSSFLDHGMDKQHAWDDYHGVAFRTMILVEVWWELREQGLLTADMSNKILQALKVHGDFLYDNNHYQPQHNHGTNEAAALFLLSVNFPDLPNADKWLDKSKERINAGLNELIDADGILIENSPYYHFYTLEKYWEVFQFSKKFNVIISSEFENQIRKMISYAEYILQPDLHVPLLGASLDRKISYSGQYEGMARLDPHLLYVLTRGEQGVKPDQLNIEYPVAGQTIMRSGWERGDDFSQQTQLIFDTGSYRTAHSDLDALSFNLFGNGVALMPDAGLYQYEEGTYRNYFHGTAAHNTVVVDGKDQRSGDATMGKLFEGEGYASQSGQHNLYDGVTHKRAITLLGKNLILIVDHLQSESDHTYEQMFHLFPDAELQVDGLTAVAKGKSSEQSIAVHQIVQKNIELSNIKGDADTPRGFCSFKYNEATPCYELSYKQYGSNLKYITLLEIGQTDKSLHYSINSDGDSIDIENSQKKYHISVDETTETKGTVIVQNHDGLPVNNVSLVDSFKNIEDWNIARGASKSTLISAGQDQASKSDLRIQSSLDGLYSGAEKKIPLDFSEKNILFKMRVMNREDVSKLEISLSSNNWKGYATNDLRNAYRVEDDGNWITVSLGKGELRESGGRWRFYGKGFDWSKVDGIRFKIATVDGSQSILEVSDLSLVDGQNKGAVVIVFDDGYESILPAAEVMKEYNFKGNIAVIENYSRNHYQGYLSTTQLKTLQDKNGWNMVNHSKFHKDALTEYYEKNNMAEFEKDVLSGAQYLIDNGLNSAPNWYIYPHGATNKEVTGIIGKYYKFARTTRNEPEVFPFGEPLGVKAFSSDGSSSEDGRGEPLKSEQILAAVQDAMKFKQTLFITFHRIHSIPTDKPGYDIGEFKKLMEGISRIGIEVKTLSELDSDNGINENMLTINNEIPSQLTLKVDRTDKGIIQRLFGN